MFKKVFVFLLFAASTSLIVSCGGEKKEVKKPEAKKPTPVVQKEVDPMKNVGIGPVKKLKLDAKIDDAMVVEGKKIYKEKCTACHKVSKKFIGPSPMGIMERRNPAWIMNMILNPDEMVKKDPIAKKLLMEFNGSPMANQNLTKDEARAIVEYFRTLK